MTNYLQINSDHTEPKDDPISIRNAWKNGDPVDVFCSREKAWFRGKIIDSYKGSTWLTVKYRISDTMDFRKIILKRFDEETIRPIS